MQGLSEHQLLGALLSLALILIVGRGSAEIARRLRQPEVLGEILGGFLLGPSVLGALVPELHKVLFGNEGVGIALSAFSWVGAILLLMIAGLEADLAILRDKVKPGALAAGLAITASLAAGALFGWLALGREPKDSFFLGVVLSVTAVSVAAKLLIERESLRRGYAQVILAAGIASEVVAWPLVSIASSLQEGNPLQAGAKTTLLAVVFFALMLTVGRRFTFWAMRRGADLTQVASGPLSLVLVLAFLSAAATEALGLHALLGAFVFGVVLGQAPRTTLHLKERLHTLTVGLFAPVFFVLAGMRINLFQLGDLSTVGLVLVLFALATLAKAGLAALGARLGGLDRWESLLVGLGVNLKGGSDVVVAILGVELGLMLERTYTMYAVVAVLTVLCTPLLLSWLEKKVSPSEEEMARLNREEARRRAYLSDIERVLVPVVPELLPATAASLVQTLAVAKQAQGEIFDITQLALTGPEPQQPPAEVAHAEDHLTEAGKLETVELLKQTVTDPDPLPAILEACRGHSLVALGAARPQPATILSFGPRADAVIEEADADVLVVVDAVLPSAPVQRILVPVNGLEYSMAAADVAGYLALAHNAEIVLFNVMHSRQSAFFWRDSEHRHLLEAGYRMLREVRFRVERLQVQCSDRVRLSNDPAEEIIKELQRRPYQLLVMGVVDRSSRNQLYLGKSVHAVLTRSQVPAVVLVSHSR